MVNQDLTALDNLATITTDDLIYVVDDPATAKNPRKATITTLITVIQANTASTDLTDTADIAYLNTTNTYTAGETQNFVGDAEDSPINIGILAGDPSALTDGDIWIAGNILKIRSGAVTLTSLDLSTTQVVSGIKIFGNLVISGQVNLSGNTFLNTGTITFPTATTTLAGSADKLDVFAATTSAELKTVISDETGSGALVFATSPTFVTPALGTPTSGALTNCTGIVATAIADGTVTDAEFQYLGDVTSLIQAQIDLKSPLASPTFTGTVTTALVDVAGNNIDNIQNLIHDQSVSGIDIDFSEDEVQTIAISTNTTFTTVNRAIGKSKTLRITTDGTLRTLDFPAWDFIGTKPTDQAASKVGILTVTCFGTDDTDIVAAYAVEA